MGVIPGICESPALFTVSIVKQISPISSLKTKMKKNPRNSLFKTEFSDQFLSRFYGLEESSRPFILNTPDRALEILAS